MEDCVFCKIIAKEIPCHLIAESEHLLAFLDIHPYTTGHTLVIPKEHYRWTYDVSNFADYWEFARQVSQKIQTKLNPAFISFLTVGADVAHAHIHIIPRYNGDSLSGLFSPLETSPSLPQLQEIAAKINS